MMRPDFLPLPLPNTFASIGQVSQEPSRHKAVKLESFGTSHVSTYPWIRSLREYFLPNLLTSSTAWKWMAWIWKSNLFVTFVTLQPGSPFL